MKIDCKPFFEKYKALSAKADEMFAKVQNEFPECVTCEIKCADCCHALFDLTLIEAIYINHRFNEMFEGKKKEAIIEKSNRADRKTYMIKRKAYKDKEAGKNEVEILMELAAERVRCPLLNEDDICDLYDYRPITCRLYGMPTSTGGIGHTCGKSAFIEGKPYPTANMDIIQKKLYEISAELVGKIRTRYVKMAEILVPLSMAILTDYNEDYLGLVDENEIPKKQGKDNDSNIPRRRGKTKKGHFR
jgi:Fe-S-cluster containining protein